MDYEPLACGQRPIYASLTLLTDDCAAGIRPAGAVNRDQDMNAAIETERSVQAAAAISDVAESIRDLIAAEIPSFSVPADDAGPALRDDKFTSLIQKIAATSVEELDRLIGELQQAKAYLQSEGERIERETAGYVQFSQTALESVKIISETVGEWRKAGHPVRGSNGA
jgi:hypothetical protein